MALKGLKKNEQSSHDEQIDVFIHGASKRIKEIEPKRHAYKRYTFSLTEDVNAEIDDLLVLSKVAKANRSIILKAAIHHLQKLSEDELHKIVLAEVK